MAPSKVTKKPAATSLSRPPSLVFTNALPIVAGMTIFGEPLPSGWPGAVRVAAFATVIVGAVLLGERKHGRSPAGGSIPTSPAGSTHRTNLSIEGGMT